MRLDHLLSKEEEVGVLDTVESLMRRESRGKVQREKISGADALMGNTRTHTEHDG